MTLRDLNNRFHSWLDDHELTKFAFMLLLCAAGAEGINVNATHPILMAACGVFFLVNGFSRWFYIQYGDRHYFS